MRISIEQRRWSLDADPRFRENISTLKSKRLSREEACQRIKTVTGHQIASKTLNRIEAGGEQPSSERLRALCIAYGLSPKVTEAVVADPSLNSPHGANPHLIGPAWRRDLAQGEFGPAIGNGLIVGDSLSAWVEREKASPGGFEPSEIEIKVSGSDLKPPAKFVQLANTVAKANSERTKSGAPGWSDNRTFALANIAHSHGADREERAAIKLTLERSWYRYNVIAKENAAEERWQQLQEASSPLEPKAHLASGLGIAVNVICRDDNQRRVILLAQRSDAETFRKGEFDVAVVEGFRPASDEAKGRVNARSVALRALHEELGLDVASGQHAGVVNKLVIFEIGCDLEYYQWNFLAFADVNLTVHQVQQSWQKAKDRREHTRLIPLPFDQSAVLEFCRRENIWSCGVACLLRTFDYW